MSHTGVAGLTLGGGLGHLIRKFGLTVDNLESVELVTAEGERRHVDSETDSELFWGLHGGSDNFGIATSFDYQLHPVGPLVLAAPSSGRYRMLRRLGFLRDFAADAPDDLGITIGARLAPPWSCSRRTSTASRCWWCCWCGRATSPPGRT